MNPPTRPMRSVVSSYCVPIFRVSTIYLSALSKTGLAAKMKWRFQISCREENTVIVHWNLLIRWFIIRRFGYKNRLKVDPKSFVSKQKYIDYVEK